MPGLSTRKLRKLFLEELNDDEISRLKFDWPIWARLKQRPPLQRWRTWLVLGGRGAGKTRTGAEWIKGIATKDKHFAGDAAGRIALVGETFDDARDVMVEGDSGLLAIHNTRDRPSWFPSRRELTWPNGIVAKLFSSADPDGIRGNQFGAAWCDATTIWGALIAVAASFSSAFGLPLDLGLQQELAEAAVQLVGRSAE